MSRPGQLRVWHKCSPKAGYPASVRTKTTQKHWLYPATTLLTIARHCYHKLLIHHINHIKNISNELPFIWIWKYCFCCVFYSMQSNVISLNKHWHCTVHYEKQKWLTVKYRSILAQVKWVIFVINLSILYIWLTKDKSLICQHTIYSK